ncbi:hypothetical protein CCHR01_19607 [Colletotrichum chrysophilum]|uniref:Uncharacterized protein n=1 Tax=Colletotrichum chrysophilum TaxID=1836956 RepID=A0AAD8ZYA7_9PEZI|nr:hypothetical protein CCHR01_19607 [Colletotrichum chrysophilum]
MLHSPPPQSPVLKHHPPSSFQSFPSGKEGALRSRSQLRSNFFFSWVFSGLLLRSACNRHGYPFPLPLLRAPP